MSISLKYTLCAVIATGVNIMFQELSLTAHSGLYGVAISVLVGTGAGLLSKYYLDKRFIFNFGAESVKHDTQTFILYALTGVATTAIFWSFEFGFGYIFETKMLRYIGGVIGLAIGYIIKYQLDKRFVFVTGGSE